MLIAHAPAGYIVSQANSSEKDKIKYILLSLIFSVLPDFDLIYYYFFDKTKTFHHFYFPHLPIVLFCSFFATFPIIFLLQKRKSMIFIRIKTYYFLFFTNWMLHLLLDTVTGGIAWLYPLNENVYKIIAIPEKFDNWMVSFIFHWSFLLELAIFLGAMLLFVIKHEILKKYFNGGG